MAVASVLDFCSVQLVRESCCNCGVIFAFPQEHYQKIQRTKQSFYCPNGHSQYYAKSKEQVEIESLQAKLRAKQADLEWTETRLERARRSKAAIQGQVTKIKKRVGNGVCPCCRRTFRNLCNHMKNQHPEWKEIRE